LPLNPVLYTPVTGGNVDRPADLQIGGLHLWVHGRQFPEARDLYDGNWLEVTARCKYSSSSVTVKGPIVTVPEVQALMDGCLAMHKTLSGSAMLDCMEPNLAVAMEMGDSSGHIHLTIRITPDNLTEEHKYEEEIDQSFLPPIIEGCRQILRQYPVRGRSPK
jgi:hypothetical protein